MTEFETIDLEKKKYNKYDYIKAVIILIVFGYGCYSLVMDLINIFI